ncbi:MAG: ATP-binding cassette domain-containing protein [Culicoidibacterales bacterium]
MGTIKLENVTIGFEEVILEKLTYEFEKKNYCLRGRNGSGKTSLIKAITDNLTIKEGKITKKGVIISYFPQEVLLFQYLSVREFLASIRIKSNDHLLAILEIDYLNQQIKNLSTGQVNKILLYLTFALCADVYIIDEIINAIDQQVKENLIDYLSTSCLGTIILITHDTNLIELLMQKIPLTQIEINNRTLIQL